MNAKTEEFVRAMYSGDEAGAAEALNAMLDPSQVAAEVRRQMGTERALAEFKQGNRDIVADPRLAGIADGHLAELTHGRRFDTLAPDEAKAALDAAGRRTRDWLQRVAPTPRGTPEDEPNASTIIAKMRQQRGQL